MRTFLTIVQYPRRYTLFALLAMLVFRVVLACRSRLGFWQLLGSGKKDGFTKAINWRQWGMLVTLKDEQGRYEEAINRIPLFDNNQILIRVIYGKIISKWLRLFKAECRTLELSPLSGHGYWHGRQPWGVLPAKTGYTGPLAVLTRASIRWSKINQFWKTVPTVSAALTDSPGLIYATGLGELPLLYQATFSIWQSTEAMTGFAYHTTEHQLVMKKARELRWFREELFVRFRIIGQWGSWGNDDPLTGNL